MNVKKITALLCAAAMTGALLTGCGKAESDTSETSSAETAASISEDTANANSASADEKELYVSSTHYTLSNPGADETAQRVYDYICGNFGEYMMTCQQESTWMGSPDYEMDYIEETTGKLPAIRGLDYMNGDFSGVNERAIKWWNEGGLVTICWHTGINGKGYQESLDDEPDFDKLLTEGTDEYNAMIANWDKAANALAELRDEGVTVLWRPFHEFDGAWFWWGKDGGDNFVKLWQMMYDRFTNEFGLTNLIWVLGYSGTVKDGWYPGDDYCDVIGSDTYDNSTNSSAWAKLKNISGTKPLAFHECGNVPSVEAFENDGCLWSWFMIWHTDYITGNDAENLWGVYNSDKVITRDELPSFKS
jgi:mannan endo-1,4-beta-mannosidase